MAFSLSNGLSVSLRLGDAEFPLDTVNRIKMLHIVESVQLQVPQLTLELIDATNLISRIGLQDGLPISISISNQNVILQDLTFRLFSYKPEQENNVQKYTITAYLDIPKYWFGMARSSIRGTSSDALAQIAQTCGLDYTGIATNDSQLWVPGLKKYSSFARYIAERGYATASSCMVLAINLMKSMVYADIMNQPVPVITLASMNTANENDYPVIDYNISSYSGGGVTNGGYFTTRVCSRIHVDQPPVSSIIETVNVNQNVNAPQISSIVRGLIGTRQVVNFGLIDCGNASEKHDAALYQNYRLKSLFTINADFVLSMPCPLSVCVPFQFNATDNSGQPNVIDSGIYITCSRVIYLNGANYFEKIAASRIGTNASY